MWQSYWDDPWVLAGWPLLRRRRLADAGVLVAATGDGIAVRTPADGPGPLFVAGAEAEGLLADPEAAGADRVLVIGEVAPALRARLESLGFDRRRTWDWYSVIDEVDPGPVDLELLDDPGEVQALLASAYPLADRRTSTDGRWWGVHRDGVLVAAGAADTWRGHAPDGSVDWNSHLRSFTVDRDHRGEGLGAAAFRSLMHEEWRRTGWVQWGAWADAEDTRGLMRSLGIAPLATVTNFRPRGRPSPSVGYPGPETA